MTLNQDNRPERPLITIREAAQLAGISQTAARRWLERGELPGAIHVGGRWWVRRRVLEAWLDGDNRRGEARAA